MTRWTTLLGIACMLQAFDARANGRIAGANQLVVAPGDTQSLLLRTTFGLLFTVDGAKNWDWLCEDAIPYGGQQDPAVALLAGGGVVLGVSEGLALSPNHGCSWSFWPGTEQKFVIDTARNADGNVAVAITNVFVSLDAGTPLYATHILRTADAGKSWQALTGSFDPTLIVDTLDLAASDPQRIYVTAKRFGAMTQAVLLVSQDTGQSYQTRTIPIQSQETGTFIAAVDPTNADRVYVRTLGTPDAGTTQTSRLLVTNDAGISWNEIWSGDKLLGFAVSPDGTRVYVGSVAAGLLAADSVSLAFTQQSSLQILCLMSTGATLYACGNEANSGFTLGASTDEGKTFAPALQFVEMRGPLQCPSGSSASTCIKEWNGIAASFGIDAGSGTPPPASNCGCETSGSWPGAGWMLAAAAIALTLRSRRSRVAR